MRVSVVIPAFNAADTILSCLESVMDGADEVIVVDDGSSDGTADLVREAYADVLVLIQSNQGVSVARNAGLEVATGDYVAFVDADDQVFPGALQQACDIVGEDGPDLVVFRSFTGESEQYPWSDRFLPGKDYYQNDIVGYIRGSVWGCFFKRKYLRRLSLRFPEGISMSEDLLFFNAAVSGGGTIRFCDVRFYEFNVRPGSASRRYDDSFFIRQSAALFKAPEMIASEDLCAQVRLSIIQGITQVAVLTGRTPDQVSVLTHLENALPLPVSSMKSGRLAAWLLNFSYPLFFRAKQLSMRFR